MICPRVARFFVKGKPQDAGKNLEQKCRKQCPEKVVNSEVTKLAEP
jgi:hypothetical protein